MASKPSAEIGITREELARLSGFRLPKAAVLERGMREVVPALTEAQVRTFDHRYGLFDEPLRHPENYKTGDISRMVSWLTPKRRQGETWLYGTGDAATARLAAWMLNEGLTYTSCVSVLRGRCVRAVLSFDNCAPTSDVELVVSGADGALFTAAELADLDARGLDPGVHRFPLAWLGITSDVLPRMQKMREDAPNVWRHRWLSREDALAAQAK